MRQHKVTIWGFLALLSISLCADAQPQWRIVPVPPPMPKALQSGFAPVNGISMYYAIYGKGSPILLIHGGLSDADAWSFEIPLLASYHKVIVADTRGHGRSTRTDERLTYDLLATDYLALLDYLHVPRVAVVGSSDGGIIGLDLAIHHPERLTALFAQAANADPRGLAMRPSPRECVGDQQDRAQYERLSRTPGQFLAFCSAVMEMWATEPHFSQEQLASIKVRTAIVIGDHDGTVRRGHTQYLAETIPGAQLIMLPDVSHFAFGQDPLTYANSILRFVDGRFRTVRGDACFPAVQFLWLRGQETTDS